MADASGLLIGPKVIQRDDLTMVIGKMSKIDHKGAHVGNFYPEKEGGKRSFWEEK